MKTIAIMNQKGGDRQNNDGGFDRLPAGRRTGEEGVAGRCGSARQCINAV